MEKIIVTRTNYEKIMFDILENQYEKKTEADILQQIEADVFLSFEWNQWKKAFYTESIEKYRFENIEFIESLVKKEPERSFVYVKWSAIAASVILPVVVYFFLNNHKSSNTINSGIVRAVERTGKDPNSKTIYQNRTKTENVKKVSIAKQKILNKETITNSDTLRKENSVLANQKLTAVVDSIIAVNVATPVEKRHKYKISIQTQDASRNDEYYVNLEKRYTLKDLEDKKDGISIQKFLIGSKSRIVNDLVTNNRILELYTSDNCVLEIQLPK